MRARHTSDTHTRARHTHTRATHTRRRPRRSWRRQRSKGCPERAAHGTKVLSCSAQPVRNAGRGPETGMMRQDRVARKLGTQCSGVGWQRARCAPDGLRRLSVACVESSYVDCVGGYSCTLYAQHPPTRDTHARHIRATHTRDRHTRDRHTRDTHIAVSLERCVLLTFCAHAGSTRVAQGGRRAAMERAGRVVRRHGF